LKTNYKIIDLFCGAGGFSEGFRQTGFYKVVLAIDCFKPAALTYKLNFPEADVLVEDIKNIDDRILRNYIDSIDVVIGSPPCEPFTATNPRRERNPLDRLYKDPIGQLTLHFIRIVGLLKPRVFIMENVPAILENGLKQALTREFRRIGYENIYFNILNAEDYGNPSRRRRVFISNIRIKPPFKERVVVWDALKDLPEPGSYPPNHEPPPQITIRKLKRLAGLKWGDSLVKFRGADGEYPNLIKLHPYRCSPTVMGSSRFIHPFENRLLTVREQARLMSFPDTFVFIGGRDEQYNMVGEAVPVALSRSIAKFLLEVLSSGV